MCVRACVSYSPIRVSSKEVFSPPSQELRKRPQSMFRIPRDKISPSQWQSVAMILKRGVGMSTLPCSKLRAIVDAATEISRLHEQEHGDMLSGGADAFLPIFIFCVVRADMERPCALCKFFWYCLLEKGCLVEHKLEILHSRINGNPPPLIHVPLAQFITL